MTTRKAACLRASSAALLALSAGVAVVPAPARAQAAAEHRGTAQLEEIVVTARRVQENVQQVPVAVTAVTQQRLNELAVNTIQDLSKVSPSLQVDPSSGGRQNFRPTIRGYGNTFGSGEQSVIGYVAEVPNFPRTFFDLQNVQVLKGPQGTLFGETAVGGAVLFEPQRPTSTFGGYVRAQGGNFDYRAIEFAVGGPIWGDKVLARLSGQIRKREGYVTAVPSYNGQPYAVDNIDTSDFRLSVILRPTDNIENYTIVTRTSDRSNGTDSADWIYLPQFMSAAVRNTAPASNPATAAAFEYWAGYAPPAGQTWSQLYQTAFQRQAAAGPFVNFVNFDKRGEAVSEGIINHAKWDVLDNLTVRDVFGMYWTRTTGATASSSSGVGLDSAGEDLPGVDSHSLTYVPGISKDRWTGGWPNRTWSNELQVIGRLFDNRLNYQGGVYYRSIKSRELQPTQGTIVVFANPQGNPASAASCATFGVTAPCTLLGRNDGSSLAFYGQATFAVTDAIHLTGGLRRTRDRRATETTAGPTYFVPFHGFNIPVAAIDQRPFPNATTTRTEVPETKRTTYNLTADWRITPDAFVYVTRRTGYKSGGINANTPPADPNRVFGPESLTNNEIGFKVDWRLGEDVRARTNVAAYWDKYKDVQRSTLIAGTAQTVTQNLANLTNKGVEFEGTFLFRDWFELNGYVSYIDAKYDNWLENSTCAAQFSRPQCAGLPTTTPVVINHSAGQLVVNGTTTNFHPDIVQFTSKWRWSVQPKVRLDTWVGEKISLGFNIYGRSKWASADTNYSQFAGFSSRAATPGVFTPFEASSTNIKGVTLVDFRADWSHIRGSNVSAAFSVTNLADKVYLAGFGNPVSICGCAGAQVGEPRMWYFDMTYEF